MDRDRAILRFADTTRHPAGEIQTLPEAYKPRVVEPLYSAGVVFECPHCGGEVNTASAMVAEVSAKGGRWVGVPCLGCLRTYTVELTPKGEEEPSGNVTQVPEPDKLT